MTNMNVQLHLTHFTVISQKSAHRALHSKTLHTHYAFSQHYSCTVDELDKEISIIEVEHAIKLLKCGKSPGQDNVLIECIKYGSVWITHIIAKLFNHLYNLGALPD